MNKPKTKRFISIIVLLSLYLSLFAGCGSSAPNDSSQPAGGSPSAESSAPPSAAVDADGYYIHEGHISRVEFPMSEDSVSWAGYVFQSVNEMYLEGKDINVYFSMIPDKNMLLAPQAGVDHLDYDAFYEAVYQQTQWMETVEIAQLLSLDDYYKTDSHWRQECITDVAEHLASAMGVSLPTEYETLTALEEFKGSYHKYYPDEAAAEDLLYLSSDIIDSFIVKDLISGKRMSVYDMKLAQGSDPYSMFLSGAMGLITIENPIADNERELVIFRDSFGSAIAPLLAQGYAKTTVIDLRYIAASFVEKFVSFSDQDVLFLHSTLLLNSSAGLKK